MVALFLLLSPSQEVSAAASLSVTSASQDANDTSEPFDFSISFSINEPDGNNAFIKGIKLSVDGTEINFCYSSSGTYSNAPATPTSIPNGNFKNGSAGDVNSLDSGYAGLSDGTYTVSIEIWYDNRQQTSDACTGFPSVTASIPFTVVGNQAPVAVDDAGAVNENSTLAVAASGILSNDTDLEGDSLSVTAIRTGTEAGSGTAGTLGASLTGTYGDLTLNADGSYSYNANGADALAAGVTATDTFTYTVSDGALTDTGQLIITITGTNDAPIAVDDAGAVDEDATVNVAASGVLGNDTDVDSGDTLTVSAVRTGAEAGSGTAGTLGAALTGTYGDLTMNADGSYSYDANNAAALAAGAQVTDTFTYTVSDGTVTDTAELVITITGVNDPPFAVDDTGAVNEDDILTVAAAGLLTNDTDADTGASLSITAIRTGPESGSGTTGSIAAALTGTYGDLTVNADGSYSYNANNANALAAGATATDTFTYTVSDGTVTDTAEIVVTITGINDAPVGVDDTGTVAEGDALTVAATGVLSNDTEVDTGDTLTVSAIRTGTEAGSGTDGTVGSPLSGTYGDLTLNADGSYTYNANNADSITGGASATDTFTYTVSDGTVTDTAEIVFTLNGSNDAPVVSDAGSTLNYILGDSATVIDATLTITDADDTNIESATVTISSGYQSSEDVLAFSNANGITGSWDSVNGELTLTGSATLVNYEAALESITYVNSNSSTSNTDNRTISWIVNDGDNDSSVVTSTITLAAPALNHYAISFDGGATTSDASGPTCTAIEVTVTAHDSSHAAVIANTTVTLSTSSGNGTWVSNSDASTIDLDFGGATNVSTYLRHVIAGATTINVTDGSVTESAGEDPTYTFTAAPLDLVFFLDADADGAPDGSGDDISTLTAGSALSQVLVGIVDSGAACTQDASIAGQTISTNLAYECVNPGTCQRDKDVTAGTTAIEDNNSGASIIYQAVSLTYNASGYAPFSLSYADAGSLKLHGSVVVPASGNNPSATVTGTSNTFVSKPADLTVTVSGNPGTTSSGSGFASAGSDFTINIQARNSAGGTTPNFGLETPAETVTVGVASLVYPTMTNAGTLTTGSYSLSGSSDGAGSMTASFSEVGSITLQASIGDGDYLGAGDVTGTASGTVGRFYPDHFSLSSDAVLDACTASTNFTYFGQNALNIDYTLTAKNASGATVTHYDAAAGYGVATISPAAEATSNNGTDLSSRLTTSSSTWSSGAYTIDDNTAVFSRSGPEAELDVYLGLTLTDALDSRNFDSLDFNPATSGDCSSAGNCTGRLLTGSAKFRWGRLNLSSASGPENQSLRIPLVAEYFDGSRYLTNSYDGCTEIARDRISFNGATIDNPANLTIDVGSGTDNSAGDSINRTLNGNDMILSSGDGNLYFSAPSPTATGTFTVSADIDSLSGDNAERPWLLFDWDLDGNHDNSPPTVTGSFGTYGGHDKILFRRLVTN